MNTYVLTILIAIVFLSIAMLGIGIRILFIKGGVFKGGCASNNPMLTDEIGTCQVCGAKKGEDCLSEE